MQALVVEPRDVLHDGELELRSAGPDAVCDQLGLEGVDEALGDGVVQRVADRPDRGEHAVVLERLAVVIRGVLAPGIGVLNERDVGAGLALVKRHAQRVQDERRSHMRGELPPDDPAAVGVDHEAEEDQALPAAQVGEVGEPFLIRAGGGEVALHEVRRS